jgi:Mg-chelatase subunit ChlD
MPRFCVRPILAALLSIVALVSPAADDRTEPIDLMVALDRSLSMRQEIGAVKQYVQAQIVDQILQAGDTFVVIAFYGQNELAVFENLTTASDRAGIKQAIDRLTPKEAFTDIGFALDRLRDEVRTRCNPAHKKTLLLITDAIDEPPPGSRYSDPGSWRGHEYMRVTSETQKEGWKIIVLGVGPEAAAVVGGAATPGQPSSVEQLARDLGGQYVQGGDKPTAGQIAQAMPDLSGRMTLSGLSISPMSRSGRTQAVLKIKTETYGAQPQLWISGVGFKGEGPSGAVSLDGLLASPVIVPLPQDGVTDVYLDLAAAQVPTPGLYRGTLEFAFGGKDQFAASQQVELRVNSLLREYPWIIPVAAVGLAAIVALVLLGVAAAGRVKVQLLVEEKPLPAGKDVFRLRKGKDAYLRESRDRFDIAEARTPKTIARLLAGNKEVALSRVKPERFPEMDDDEPNVLGGRYVVRAESGGTFHLRFERAP